MRLRLTEQERQQRQESVQRAQRAVDDYAKPITTLIAAVVVITLFGIFWSEIDAWADWLVEQFMEGPPSDD